MILSSACNSRPTNDASKAGQDIPQTNAFVFHVFWIQTALSDSCGLRNVPNSYRCKAGSHQTVFYRTPGKCEANVFSVITQCCMHELYLQGKARQPAVDLAKTFERRKCNHREAIPGDECLSGVVGDTNKHRYVVATQSQSLRNGLRIIPAVPVIHINRAVMVLEPPSEATLKAKELTEEQSLRPSAPELATVPRDKPMPKKRKGPKGPNPLSVKKKKNSNPENSTRPSQKTKAESLDTSSSTAQLSGQKRKRDFQDDKCEEQSAGMTNPAQNIASTRTRKRHRKAPAVSPSSP